MGTFIGHIVPGLALSFLGLWHTLNTINAYCMKGPSNFTVKFWHPVYNHFSSLKYLDLIFILFFSVFAIFMQLLDYPAFQFAFKLDSFEHATMFLHLAMFAGFTLSAEMSNSSDILAGVVGILATSVFGQELFLLRFHSADHVGLEGHYHWLLQLIVIVSLIAALAATSFPTSFPAALVLSVSVTFQGCWFMNMGFMLWDPHFVPKGCVMQHSDSNTTDMHGAVICGSPDAESRAKALANLQFSWILFVILLFTGCVCLKLAPKCISRTRPTEYERLHSINRLQYEGTDIPVTNDIFKQAGPFNYSSF